MGAPGKCSNLPYLIQEELNARLLNNVPQVEILREFNAREDVQRWLAVRFEGRPITPQNLSDYANSESFAEWREKNAARENARKNAKFVTDLAQEAGLDLSDTGDAIFTSRMLELMEVENDTDKLVALGEVFARLRASTVSRGSLAVRQKELAGRERKLALAEKTMEMNTVKAFIKFAQSKEAQGIVASGKPKHVQMDLLHELMFGKKPQPGE